MNDLTSNIIQKSIENVRKGIDRKKSSLPYMANGSDILNVVTDYDHWPYTRWFRGVYYYPEAIVAEREAGWRPIENRCYSMVGPFRPEPSPNISFEAACSTSFPYFNGIDKGSLDNAVNKNCLVQYY